MSRGEGIGTDRYPTPTPTPTPRKRSTMFYAGSNIPGYLPTADEPNIFATFRDAKEWMLSELSFAADHDDERGDSLAAMAEDLNLCGSHDETEWGDIAYRVDDMGEVVDHDLGIAYWITWEATDCDCGQQATMVGEDPHTWENIPQCEACYGSAEDERSYGAPD